MNKCKKLISILILFFIICGQVSNIAIELTSLEAAVQTEAYEIKVTNSKPEFYGTVGINLKVGDELDLDSSIFRIFAKDFYDGDLTQDINIIENTVNTQTEGNYYIKYSVSNSSGNITEIEVPVVVSQDKERTVQRKLYEAEDVWNMDLTDTKRGNYHDRQNLGIYAKAGANIKIREINNYTGSTLTGDLFNNDRNTETTFTVTNEWTTITPEYDSVPFLRSYEIDGDFKYINYANINQYSSDFNRYDISVVKDYCIEEENTFYFANVFETNGESDEIHEIKIPFAACTSAEVYILNSETGDINNTTGEYRLIKSLENPLNGYQVIKLNETIKIESEYFIIAVKCTATKVPVHGTEDIYSFTYISGKLSNKWDLFKEGKKFTGSGYINIPPIICKSTQKTQAPIIEINIEDIFEEDSLIKPLDYYLYGDNEEKFFEKWNTSQNSYAVLENDRVTFLTPLKDKDKILHNTDYSYNSVTEIFDLYNDIFKMYDLFIGVEDVPEERINQNVKTKYFVKADNGYSNKNAIAYYSNNYTAKVGNTITDYFYRNWLILHEIGHGYEGLLDRGNVNLAEAANNIFAYYYQKKHNDYEWMGSIYEQEKNWNNIRKNFSEDMTFNQILDNTYTGTDHYHIRLYMMVNILNKIDPKNGMSAYYIASRKDKFEGKNTSNSDLLAESFLKASGFNVIPYLESWHIEVSEDTKQNIENQDAPILYYLRDLVKSEEQAEQIRQELGLEGIYSLVTNDEINKYNLKGSASIQLTEEEYSKLEGNNIILKSGGNIIKEVEVESADVNFIDVPIGIYEVETLSDTDTIETKYLIVQQDSISPELTKLEVTSPETGTYAAGQEITIVGTFDENIQGIAPSLKLLFGVTESKGTASTGVINENTITWTYTIQSGDNGNLTAKVIGIYGELTDVNGKNPWLLESPDLSGNIVRANTSEIIFNNLKTIVKDGINYVKVSPGISSNEVTADMKQETLYGKIPVYTNITQEGKLKTGSQITLDGETKYTVVIKGDVNCDGEVDFLGDIITANDHRIGLLQLNTIQKLAADIDNNGEIDFLNDIIAINDYRIGIKKLL